MNKPKLTEYFLPVLKSFEQKKKLSRAEIVDFLTRNYDLIERDTPRRSFIMINTCIGYYLKAKVLERTRDNSYKITERGEKFLLENDFIDVTTLRQFREFDDFISHRSRQEQENKTGDKKNVNEEEMPEDKILSAYELYKENLSFDILEKIKKSSWQFFELMVKDLLVAMGYGDPFDEERITRGAADDGIDGIIKADPLGLDVICIQAKKWDGTIGRPEIQKFAGSLESYRAGKGVFITTSKFSSDAKEYVKRIGKKIILIDGERLAELMIDYGIGVSVHKEILLKRIDSDYFDGD